MDEKERKIRQRLKDEFEHYAKKALKIRSKSGVVVPFTFNSAQRHLHTKVEHQLLTTNRVRVIIVKGRQQGISTYVEGRIFWRVTHNKGRRAFILTHDSNATQNLFEMSQRFYSHCPSVIRPTLTKSNANEMIFGGMDDSGYKIGTAGNKGEGRSSTIQYLHGSEVAYWPNSDSHAKGIMQSVPNEPGTEIYLESTANGLGNYFHEQWQLAESGESDFIPVFIPWYWQQEYRRSLTDETDPGLTEREEELVRIYNLDMLQINWRRYKIIELSTAGANGERSFDQEYPSCPADAFNLSGDDTFIKPSLVLRARNVKVEGIGKLIVGCDPARYGNDRTAIAFRRGRKIESLRTYTKKDNMEVVGILVNIIRTQSPDFVCVDVGGLGAGIYDRLVELGFGNIVIPVNSSETAINSEKYFNKRAEMWGELSLWLQQTPCEIPDSDELHADLCAPRYDFDSNGRIRIESKERMKKRGLRSSDCADACGLTLALPKEAIQKTKVDAELIAAKIMQRSQRISSFK